MAIQRNLNELIPEPVRRTLVDFDRRMGKVESLLRTIKPSNGGGNGGLSPEQFAILKASLIGAFGQPVVGDNSTPDPFITPIGTGAGTLISFASGNLSPLFTSSVANPTTSPSQTFAQVNQAANLMFAGPATGAAAPPTFRLLVAADLHLIGVTLLSSTVLNLNTNTKQNLYIVPTGRSALPLWVALRSASVDLSGGLTASLTFGFNGGATDWGVTVLPITDLTSNTEFKMFGQFEAASGGGSVIGAATDRFGAITDAAFGSAATLVVDVFGYLF